MLCDDCKKNPAIKTYKEQFQDKTIELHLCQECADKRGLVVKKDLTPAELLQNLLKHEAVDDATVICPRCLLSLPSLRDSVGLVAVNAPVPSMIVWHRFLPAFTVPNNTLVALPVNSKKAWSPKSSSSARS